MPVTLLEQRQIEAAILKPTFDAIAERWGRDAALDLIGQVVEHQAFQKGRDLRTQWPAGDIPAFAQVWDIFAEGDALDVEFVERRPDYLHLKVTRCRYAESYAAMGIADLGFTFSCRRDQALAAGYSDTIALERRSTIQEGAPCCEFIYTERAP